MGYSRYNSHTPYWRVNFKPPTQCVVDKIELSTEDITVKLSTEDSTVKLSTEDSTVKLST